MRTQGKIITWKDDKGFGFVAPEEGGRNIFIHKNAFLKCVRQPKVGDIVTFEVFSSLEGKTWGESVLFRGQRDPRKNGVILDIAFITLALLFGAAILGLIYSKLLPWPIIALYLSVSFLTFFMYRFDKQAAEFNDWRIREDSLHLLSLFGGWPGALVAQRVFHHKTKKTSFQILFWTTVLLNIGFLFLFFSPSLRKVLPYGIT